MGLQVGHVYILTNQAIPKLIKIGMTTGDPEARARKLSGTGTPGKWRVYAKVYVPNCGTVERLVHQDLRKCRDAHDREFFRITPDEALKAIHRRAKENSDDYPGWPDPIAVQDNLDKQELQRRKEEQEREEQRRREIEARRRQAEREKLDAEQKRKEEAAKELEERRKLVDASTRKTLQEGLIGWGTVGACIFFGLVFSKNSYAMWFAVTVVTAYGIWMRKESKKDAIELRKQWNLPSIYEDKVAKEALDRIVQQKQPSVTQKEKKRAPLVIGIVVIVGLLWALSSIKTPTRQDSITPTSEPTTTPTQIYNSTQINDYGQAQQRAELKLEEEANKKEEQQRQADLARQAEEAKRLQKKNQKRQDTIKQQRATKQQEVARRQKKAAKNDTATQSANLNQQPYLAVCKYKRVMSNEDYQACGIEPPHVAPQKAPIMDSSTHQKEEEPSRIKVWTHRGDIWTQH